MFAAPRHLLSGLSELIWPRRCWLCEGPVETTPLTGSLCQTCRHVLAIDSVTTCPRCTGTVGPHTDVSCGCERCRGSDYHFALAVRLGPYDSLLREAVLRLKQESGEGLAEDLGELLGESRSEFFRTSGAEVVVPVPLHWRRRFARGYNQSEAIARGLAHRLGLPCRANWLRRIRPTPTQRAQSATARWENVKGAFRTRRGIALAGRRVLLVDDVLTTGATADAAAIALRGAGAHQVCVAVLAHR